MLDWEMVAVANPLQDLAYWLILDPASFRRLRRTAAGGVSVLRGDGVGLGGRNTSLGCPSRRPHSVFATDIITITMMRRHGSHDRVRLRNR